MNKINLLLIMRNIGAKTFLMVFSLLVESPKRNSKQTAAGMPVRLFALVPRSWWVDCWCFLFFFLFTHSSSDKIWVTFYMCAWIFLGLKYLHLLFGKCLVTELGTLYYRMNLFLCLLKLKVLALSSQEDCLVVSVRFWVCRRCSYGFARHFLLGLHEVLF